MSSMSARKSRIVLVGIGGYGNVYLEELLRGCAAGRVALAGTVDPEPSGCRYLAELHDLRVPHFAEFEEFVQRSSADLAVLSTPIHFHEEHTCRALAAGMSVLCEKPLAPGIEQAMRMKRAEKQSGGFVAVGYQWSFAEPVLALKRDIMAGRLGQPLRFKSLTCWPRPLNYFSRNNWVGRITLPGNIRVLDSPANNAMAHYLHNMLYLLGGTMRESAKVEQVCAELYRANAIENYDTVAMRCWTDKRVPALFYATHAVPANRGPILEYEFQDAVVRLNADGGNHLVVSWRDGRVEDYGEIFEYPHRAYFRKLWHAIEALEGGTTLPCTIDSAMPHVVCIEGAQRAGTDIPSFAQEFIEWTESESGRVKTVRGLQQALTDCYINWSLPAERGMYPWAMRAPTVDTRGTPVYPRGSGVRDQGSGAKE